MYMKYPFRMATKLLRLVNDKKKADHDTGGLYTTLCHHQWFRLIRLACLVYAIFVGLSLCWLHQEKTFTFSSVYCNSLGRLWSGKGGIRNS